MTLPINQVDSTLTHTGKINNSSKLWTQSSDCSHVLWYSLRIKKELQRNFKLLFSSLVCLFFVLFCFCFSGPHPQHMEVPRLGVKSELQLLAYTTVTAMRDRASSANYTTAPSNIGSLTHWVSPGIELASPWTLVRFISALPQWELRFCSIWMLCGIVKNVIVHGLRVVKALLSICLGSNPSTIT